jgi:uncharacterized protein
LRCVFDTNVLVSALLIPGSIPQRALERAFRSGDILLSLALLAELSEVLTRKQFRRYVDEEDVRRFVVALTREAQLVDVDVQIKVCRDADDDKILELAVSGLASHIVTGDLDLLVLDPFRGIRIISPQMFLGV